MENTPQIPHFMPGGLGSIGKYSEDEEAKQELKVSKYINELDEELRDRFKALKVIQDLVHDADEEENKEIRKLEIEFENKYKMIYEQRNKFINGLDDETLDTAKLIEEFAQRAQEMKDDDYDKLEVVPCDVKAIQNIPKGISDFWIKAILNHPIGGMVSEKDRPILGYLTNVELDLHSGDKGQGFDLIFTFLPNSYFNGTQIKKEMHMKNKGMLDKTISTEIAWKDACNPTITKKKKKRKGKKVTVEVKTDSFFNFFTTLDPDAEKKDGDKKPKDEEDEEDGEEEIMEKLQEDLDLAEQFKDDLVPLALEYYLGVIEIEDEEDDDDSEGKANDSDDDGDAKKKKKKKQPKMPVGPDGKQEECKQQ